MEKRIKKKIRKIYKSQDKKTLRLIIRQLFGKRKFISFDEMENSKFYKDLENGIEKMIEDGAKLVLKIWKKEKQKWQKELIDKIKEFLPDCVGCTDEKSEGTHQAVSKQHFEELLKGQSN